jgi:Clp amino terminal domain, pathogenicity island component
MFDRYTEDARRAIGIANEEAAKLGSPYIEAEHLLLGISRSSEPDLKEALRIKDVEDALRADLMATAQLESSEKAANVPLSNPSKRVLAYAAEEAVRLNSWEIGSGHLLLGVLRESESIASRFFAIHNVDLQKARRIVAGSRIQSDTEKSTSTIGLASTIRRRYWIGMVGQLAMIVLLGVAVAKSTITGRHLLAIAAIWFMAALAWNKLGPSSFFLSLGKRNRVKIAFAYAFGWLHQLFMFGWLFPLGVGIYRVTVR